MGKPSSPHSGKDRDARKTQRSGVIREVLAIYDGLPSGTWARDCRSRTTCCRFRLTGKTPHLTKGEALALAAGLRASGRTTIPPSPDGSCPLLEKQGRCLAYAHRPLGCRTHFCEAAGGMIPRADVLPEIRRLEEIDRSIGGVGPRALPGALDEVMREW
jgi:Fe-S-cluster containining protein